MSSIEEVRNKIQHEFKTKEEFYVYRELHGHRFSEEELYKDASDSLLPVFKVAKEMCEHISGDKDYFSKNDWEQGYPLTRLYHMAIVSKVIQDINENCVTTEDKKECILHTRIYGNINYYVRNGEPVDARDVLDREKIKTFMRVSGHSFDDQYYRRYMEAVREDIKPEYSDNKKPRISVTGNTLGWDNMKDSRILFMAAYQFIGKEAARLREEESKENYSGDGMGYFWKQAEQNIKNKINEFCDMKQAQFIKQMQKSNTEVKE